MRKLVACIVVLVLLAVAATPALAAGKGPSGGNKDHGAPSQDHGNPHGNPPGKTQEGTQDNPQGKGHKVETEATPAPVTETEDEETPPAPRQPKVRAAKQQGKSLVAGTVPGPSPRAHGAFVMGGTIGAFDPISGTLTISITHGNRLAQSLYGEAITLTLSADTRVLVSTPEGTVWMSVEDLEAGQNVMIKGWVIDDDWTASWVKVGLGLGRKIVAPPEVTTEPEPITEPEVSTESDSG